MADHGTPEMPYADFGRTIEQWSERKGRPMACQWEITFHCNLRCVHCYVVEDPAKKELSLREITEIFDQIHDEGCLWLSLTGGEPLSREDFLDIYSYAVQKGFLITLMSNGTLLTPEIADYLQQYPPLSIEITLHGITGETYERISRVPGSYQAGLEGIDLLLARDLPVTLKSVGMTLNRNEIPKIKEYAGGLGKVGYRYDPLLVPRLDRTREPCQLRLSPEEIVQLESADSDMRNEWEVYLRSRGETQEPNPLFPCGAGVHSFNISPYGELQICHLLRKPYFDLRRLSLRDGLKRLRRTRPLTYRTSSACRECGVRSLCSQCPGRAQLENDHMENPISYFCELSRQRREMKRRLVHNG